MPLWAPSKRALQRAFGARGACRQNTWGAVSLRQSRHTGGGTAGAGRELKLPPRLTPATSAEPARVHAVHRNSRQRRAEAGRRGFCGSWAATLGPGGRPPRRRGRRRRREPPKENLKIPNRQARYFEEDEGLAAVMTAARKSRGDAPAAGCDPAPHCRHGPPLFKQRAWTTWPHGKASSNSREAKTHLPHLAQASDTFRAGSSPTVLGETS